MPSSPYPASEKIRNLFSVICGVVLFFALLFAVFPLFNEVYTRLYSGNETAGSATLVSGIYFLMFFVILVLCGMLTGLIATRKKALHSFITGCVLVILYIVAIGKDINWASVQSSTETLVQNISVPVLLLIGPVVGGMIAKLFRKKKKEM